MNQPRIERVAGIDLGSNSLKMAVAGLRDGHPPEITIRERVPLRLATDAFDRERFGDATIERLIAACWRFSEILEQVRVSAYRAVATEAFRRVENVEAVVERIAGTSNLEVEILSPEEEMRLTLEAIRTGMIGGREPDLLVDLGGGSIEICTPAGEEETGLRLESHALGLASRFEAFLAGRPDDRDTRVDLRLKANELAGGMSSQLLDGGPLETVAITGGQASMLDSLAEEWGLWSVEASTLNGVTPEELNALCERTVSEDAATLVGLGIPPDRAPMLAGAAAFYHALAIRAGADRIVIPGTGLMEGLLLTLPAAGRPWPPR